MRGARSQATGAYKGVLRIASGRETKQIGPAVALLRIPAQIERRRQRRIARLVVNGHRAGCMTMRPEPCEPPRFRLVGVDGKRFVVATARVRNVISAAADGALRPTVDEIEAQRRLHANRRMQRRRGTSCAEAHAGDELAGNTGGGQRDDTAIARHGVTLADHPGHLDLKSLD